MKAMWALSKFIVAGVTALCLLQGQSPSPGEKASLDSAASGARNLAGGTAAVAPAQAVITVRGSCGESKAKTPGAVGPCAAVVTREQFENLVQALHPGQDLASGARNNLARLYAEYLAVEVAAREAGIEDTAQFREFMNWMRVLAASEYYRRKLQEKYSSPPQEEIHAYYQQHLAEYETVRLARVLIPRGDSATHGRQEFELRAREAANAARESLLKGLDAMEVQKNAYRALGLGDPPAVDLGKQRRKDLMAGEATEVFSSKPGEITQIQAEPANYVIYKVMSRETVSEESLKKSISVQLTELKFKEAMKSLLDSASADLNEQYFGAATDSEPPRSPHTIIAH